MPPHFELKSNEMTKKKKTNAKKTTTNESLNSHWLPANVAGRLTVLPANCKIHPHLARGRVLISGPAHNAPQGSRVRPNFSRVRLTKIPERTGASSHSRKEKKVSVTQKLYVVQQKTPPLGLYHGLNQSEIVKGGPPL